MKDRQRVKWGHALFVLALCLIPASRSWTQVRAEGSQVSLNDVSAKGTLAVYQDFTKYPPESRPLSTSNWDLLHPWSTDTSSMPLIPSRVRSDVETLRASGLSEDEAWRSVAMPSPLPRYQFEMSKTILAGVQDVLRARLTVSDQTTNAPMRIHITKAELIGDEDFGSPHLGSVPVSCESGSSCTLEWHAPSADKLYWGVLDLVVTLSLEGVDEEFVVRQSFYSSPIVAGKFTGQFRERLSNGSLLIDAGVKVQRRMVCFLGANLFSVDRELPSQHAERRLIVDPSMKEVTFTFFGKIFRDLGHQGTFRIQDLKAQCENLQYPPEWFMDSLAHQAELEQFQNNPPATREPTRIYFASNNYTFTTRRYPAGVFSDQEWQSPEKNRKLEALKKAAEELADPALELRKRQAQQEQPPK